ncbi:hypothetical protein pclt_cds_716 [Pandoravirus celtis]|uniref:Uncharacterized protein n=1 Tax=Pandoravirus celtis TaxID=2568002 RepID=A0A4D6EIZ4_9VIRU|nr:hypothetical protein pclt_cds_716 [Pandoravirus celtis]
MRRPGRRCHDYAFFAPRNVVACRPFVGDRSGRKRRRASGPHMSPSGHDHTRRRGTWAFCCRRDFGPERVALYVEREHFGVRWLCLYAAMAIRLDFGQSADMAKIDRPMAGYTS